MGKKCVNVVKERPLFPFAVTTSSSKEDLRGRTLVHLSLDLSESGKLNLDLPPTEFYKLCLEMERAKFQLELLLKTSAEAHDEKK
jgi:hypothetical protein